ncbi:hypothetical protein FB451DRAFT_1378632 [Mycena latifolia]|nr:hypothetical protein FB451DRAFT_1378632 [Mycena latifolia]
MGFPSSSLACKPSDNVTNAVRDNLQRTLTAEKIVLPLISVVGWSRTTASPSGSAALRYDDLAGRLRPAVTVDLLAGTELMRANAARLRRDERGLSEERCLAGDRALARRIQPKERTEKRSEARAARNSIRNPPYRNERAPRRCASSAWGSSGAASAGMRRQTEKSLRKKAGCGRSGESLEHGWDGAATQSIIVALIETTSRYEEPPEEASIEARGHRARRQVRGRDEETYRMKDDNSMRDMVQDGWNPR